MSKVSFWKKVFCDLYDVTILLKTGETKKFRFTELKKINHNYLKGIDEQGHKIEYRSEEKFDYLVKKIY